MTTHTKTLDQVHIGLSTENRGNLVERLNTLLADEHLLYTKTRNYHWNVTGIHFSTLHALFEQQYDRLKLMADEVAERTRMLGGTAVGTLTQFLERTRLAENGNATPTAADMLANLVDDHEQIISNVRQDIEACANQFNDEGTADLLVGIMRSHEEMAWMLRAMTKDGS